MTRTAYHTLVKDTLTDRIETLRGARCDRVVDGVFARLELAV